MTAATLLLRRSPLLGWIKGMARRALERRR
jgi:hypothetical protein